MSVALNVDSATTIALIEYEGDEELVKTTKGWLPFSYGHDGHMLSDRTNARALDFAMTTQAYKHGWTAKRIAGGELLSSDEPLPDGVVS